MSLIKGMNCGFVLAAPSMDPNSEAGRIDFYASAMKAVAPPWANKVTEIGWWCDNETEACDFEVGIYGQNSGDDNPEALVGKSSPTAKGTTAGWKKVTGLSITITAGQVYWIGIQVDNTATQTETDRQTDAGEKNDILQTVAELPDPWGISTSTYGRVPAIYAVYETSVPTNTKSNGSLYGELPSAA